MMQKYFVVQCLENGEWINYSCKYVLKGLDGALKFYKFLRWKNPNWKLRIARGKDEVKWY